MRRYRVVRHFAFCWLALLFVPFVHAQKTQADLNARLLNKPLFLRDTWYADKLEFDPHGQLLGDSKRVAFTLAGIDVTDVKLSSSGLTIWGHRMGIVFDKDAPQRISLQPITISIAGPTNWDYAEALDSIFVTDLSHMRPFVPSYWQQYLAKHFPSPDKTVTRPELQVQKIGGGATATNFVEHAYPELNLIDRALKFASGTTLQIVVGKDGIPQELSIARPIGLGLDEQAIATAAKYRFKPAMHNGFPVSVHVNIEVNFQAN